MRILFAFTAHRRTLNVYYARAARRLGHDVRTVGPWSDQESFGTHGREPDKRLTTRAVPDYAYSEIAIHDWQPDIVWLLEGGENLRILDVPRDISFVHQSVEGAHMDWSRGITPHRYVNFTHQGHREPDVTWLPYGFDRDEVRGFAMLESLSNVPPHLPMADREYDCVQIGSPRPARAWLWEQLRKPKDVHCWFSPHLWGPAHFALYRNARSTFCNQTQDFLCPRVFDAMAMGCLLFSDRVPALLELFGDGEHVVGYDAVKWQDGESLPDPDWMIEHIRRCRREPAWAAKIAEAGQRLVWAKHSYEHRVEKVLKAVEAVG